MLLEAIRMAIEALCRNAMRSGLTALGVLIGVGAVIAMVAIGQAASASVAGEIARLGSELLTLSVGQRMRGGQGTSITAQPFDYADIEAIRSHVRGLRHVAPLSSRPMRVVARNTNWTTKVIGTENGYFRARRLRLASGREFTEQEMHNGRPVCIIGVTVARQLYGGEEAAGEPLRIGSIPCVVIGVLAERGQSGASEDDDNVVAIPFDTFQRRVQGSPDIQSIVMAGYPGGDMQRLKSSVVGLIRERRRIAVGAEDDFTILDMRQVAESMTAATGTLTLFLGAIAAVSLIVGGIGITNIMLVSVSERTREIGVRLAIGATPAQVRLQFLVEAVLLTMLGAIAGVAAGIAVAAFASSALGLALVVDPTVILMAVGVSAALGIGFGFAPAAAAARLDPVEALRHD